MSRWLERGFFWDPTEAQRPVLHRTGKVYHSLAADTAGRKRLVVDYTREKWVEPRTFGMDQLDHLDPELIKRDNLFKADLKDGYYHLRLRERDNMRLSFFVGDRVVITLSKNCDLFVAPWVFTKAMDPVVGFLQKLRHSVYA